MVKKGTFQNQKFPFEKGGGYLLKIDIDKKEDIEEFLRRREVLKRFHIVKKGIDIRKTSKGYHIRIELSKDLSNEKIIFLQLFLMSDYMRELFNFIDLNSNMYNNTLFSMKFKDERLIMKEGAPLFSKGNF